MRTTRLGAQCVEWGGVGWDASFTYGSTRFLPHTAPVPLQLWEDLNAPETCYPGTSLRLVHSINTS